MPAKRLRSADIVVFPYRARVDVYEFAQEAARQPLEDRERFIEDGLIRALKDIDQEFPQDIADAKILDLEQAVRGFLSGMKKSRKRKSAAKVQWQTGNHDHGDRAS